MDMADCAILKVGGAVVGMHQACLGKADDAAHPVGLLREPGDLRAGNGQGDVLVGVPYGVARERQFGKDDQVGVFASGLPHRLACPARVLGHVAEHAVDLSQSDAHGLVLEPLYVLLVFGLEAGVGAERVVFGHVG